MFGLSIWHVVVAAALIALLLGSRHIPSFMGRLGRGIGAMKRGTEEKNSSWKPGRLPALTDGTKDTANSMDRPN